MEQISLQWEAQRRVYTVGELTAAIRGLLAKSFEDIWVAGEISGVKPAASGHFYFTLKDAAAQLRCACYRSALRWMKFRPQDGIAVVARGRLDVYEPRGEYQFIVETMEPQGFGALQLAFEQLKTRLEAEGLFAAARKRPLPRLPRRIGIVTSPTGAVIRDVIQILRRRFPGLHLRLYPAQVQGPGSVEAIVEGIDYFSRSGWAEAVIVCRGGGSLEDLWTFNEEAVARAIAGSAVPVISAVGHETDYTIADFVADLRAPTPSAAAEIAICTRAELLDEIEAGRQRLERGFRFRLAQSSGRVHQQGIERASGSLTRRIGRGLQRVDELESLGREAMRAGVDRRRRRWQALEVRLRALDPRLGLSQARLRLDTATAAAAHQARLRLAEAGRRLDPLAAALGQLSPLRILERGYAIVQDPAGRILRDSKQTKVGGQIGVRLWRGRLTAVVSSAE